MIAEGMTAQQAARKAGVSEQTYYRWRKEYGGLKKTVAIPENYTLNFNCKCPKCSEDAH